MGNPRPLFVCYMSLQTLLQLLQQLINVKNDPS